MKAPVFMIDHIGLNNPDEKTAMDVAEKLCDVFGLEMKDETPTRVFAGDLFEVKKNLTRGPIGHIALKTGNMDEALTYFEQKGIGVLEKSIRRDENGRITFAFLDLEIAGFMFHLTV